VQWVPGLFPGRKRPYLAPRLKKGQSCTSTPPIELPWPLVRWTFICGTHTCLLPSTLMEKQHFRRLFLWDETLRSPEARFRRVRPARKFSKVLPFHDSARTHTCARVAEAITNFVWTVLPHDSFNDAVSISDYVASNGGKVSSLIKWTECKKEALLT